MTTILTGNRDVQPDRTALENRTPLWLFVVLSYGFSWSLWYVASRMELDLPSEWPSKETFWIVGGFGPSLAAILIRLLDDGRRGFHIVWRSLANWNAHPKHFAIAFSLPLAIGVVIVVGQWLSGNSIRIHLGPWWVAFLLANFFLAPLGEEIGWRGYLLPRMEEHRSGLRAALMVGVTWGFWHLPIRLHQYSSQSPRFVLFLMFTVYALALSVFLTWLYNRSGGSIPVVMVFHVSVNMVAESFRFSSGVDAFVCLIWFCTLWSIAAAVLSGIEGSALAKSQLDASMSLP